MSNETQALGERGERIAESWLRARGWRTLDRRFRNGHRDLDLVMERSGIVAFVEVKARRGSAFGTPIEAVDWRKRRELIRSAMVWLDRRGGNGDSYQFDVVGVLLDGERVRIQHVPDAFEVSEFR